MRSVLVMLSFSILCNIHLEPTRKLNLQIQKERDGEREKEKERDLSWK